MNNIHARIPNVFRNENMTRQPIPTYSPNPGMQKLPMSAPMMRPGCSKNNSKCFGYLIRDMRNEFLITGPILFE